MARVLVVEDEDVRRVVLERRLGGAVGEVAGAAHLSTPPAMDALERAIDAAIRARPPALMAAVRARLARLGADDGEEARSLLLQLITAFVEQAPGTLVALETALAEADDVALEAGAARLGAAAEHLGAGPLARLCTDLENRARTGSVPPAAAVRAPLRRELVVTCRVMRALATELSQTEPHPTR